LIISVFYF